MPSEARERPELDPAGNAAVQSNGDFAPVNPLLPSQLHYYSLAPAVVPPYVIDRLSQAHYKDQLNNSNVNNNQADTQQLVRTRSTQMDEEQFVSFANDPFISSVKNSWRDLLNAVKQPSQFTEDRVSNSDSYSEYGDFSKPWGGDERLRHALLGSASDPASDVEALPGFWARLFGRKARLEDSPRHRLKAGYWMLDEKRKDLAPTLRRIFVQNPLVPLFLRILILVFSVLALGLASSIYLYLRKKYEDTSVRQEPSTIFAIVVQSLAIIYIIYIAYDEYSGKPLGLRNPLGKMKLIMLDLLFIMCSSANMSLTFDSLFDDEWVCTDSPSALIAIGIYYPSVGSLCRRQRALAAFLLIVLCLWVLTFTISIVRVVDRVSVSPRTD